MFNIIKTRSTPSAALERWYGADAVNLLSKQMTGWYGSPIAIGTVAGKVFACGDGDFIGRVDDGSFASLADRTWDRMRTITKQMAQESKTRSDVGFSSLSDMISKWTQDNKGQTLTFMKTQNVSGISGRIASNWATTGSPGAGAAGAAAPAGTTHAKGDVGSYPIINTVTASSSLHIVSAFATTNGSQNTMMLYDRLFSVAKTMSSTASETVTGTFSRYNVTTSTEWNYCGGNFLFPECTSALSATAHNWDSIQYTDQDGNTGQTCPSTAGVSSCAQYLADLVANNWWMPLASGDIGFTALTSMKCSASVTGGITWVAGHPLVLMPSYTGNTWVPQDFTNSSFGVVRMYDTACLALATLPGNSGSAQPSVFVNLLAS